MITSEDVILHFLIADSCIKDTRALMQAENTEFDGEQTNATIKETASEKLHSGITIDYLNEKLPNVHGALKNLTLKVR